jgi:pimeloyl-ACP methyl ester carboxylesterase
MSTTAPRIVTDTAMGQSRARYPDEEGFVERDGVRLFYEVYGSGEPTVLLLPTWSIVHSRHWKMQVPYLARHCRVLTFDGRGNGRSDRPTDPQAYAEAEFAADVCWASQSISRSGCSLRSSSAIATSRWAWPRPRSTRGSRAGGPRSARGRCHALRPAGHVAEYGASAPHFSFAGYVTGFDPAQFADRAALRAELGYAPDEQACIVTVGGSGVGGDLLRRVVSAFPEAKERVPALRMIVVAGPRIDPQTLPTHEGLEVRAYVQELYRHLAACDLAVVQGGLTTSMELTANRRPFLYFPLRHHFEQNFHVRHRLERYGAGRSWTSSARRRRRSPPRSPKPSERRSTTGRSRPTAPRGQRR